MKPDDEVELLMDTYMNWPGGTNDLITLSFYRDSTPVSEHRHEFVEIVFITKGSCTHSYCGTDSLLMPGDVFIVVPHEEHSYSITSETCICNLLFYPGVLGEDWTVLREISGLFNFIVVEPFFRFERNANMVLHLLPDELVFAESLLRTIDSEQQAHKAGYMLVQKASLITLLTCLGRIWDERFNGQALSFKRQNHLLGEAISYIQDHVSDELRISDLAAQLYLSPDYFRKLFKQVTGLSPVEYINNLRLAIAESLLKETSLSIGEVAERVGISDLNYFTRLFRTTLGCTPTEYRKKIVLS